MRIGLDIDGVVADFGAHFLNYLDIEDKTPAKCWDDIRFKENFKRIDNDAKFWLTMPPLVSIDDLKFEPTVFVTARNIDKNITQKWLDANGFGGIPLESVGMDISKVEAVSKYNIDFFIDDAVHNYDDLNNNGINCILMDRSHNRDAIANRIYNLNEVLDYVHSI